MINVGVGVPSIAWASYEALLELMAQLGQTVSKEKLVPPATCVTCLGQRSKLGFYVPFNSQGHIGTGPQNCHLWDSNPQR